MADNRKDCIDDILKGLGGRMNRKQVEDRFEEIDDRAQSRDDYRSDPRGAYHKATLDLIDEEATNNAILRRNMRMDAMKDRTRHQFYESARAQLTANGEGAKAARLAMEARLVGINRPIFDEKSRMGNQDSVGALGLGKKLEWIGGVVGDLRRIGREDKELAGLDRIFFSRKNEDNIFLEKFELDLGPKGRPGKTNDTAALKIAEVLHKWDKVRVDALNGEGAWISNYAGWMFRMAHDPDKMRKASNASVFRKGFDPEDRLAWVSDVLGWIDAKRTFGAQEADQALAKMYGGLIDGSHLNPAHWSEEPLFPNVARKVSESKDLHWKSGAAALAYNRKYGRFTPTDAWVHGMEKAADQYALMKIFGSKPKEGFETDLSFLYNKTAGTKEGMELRKWAPEPYPGSSQGALRNRFAVLSGEANIPVMNLLSGIVDGVMSVTRMAKLGFTPFAMITDNMTISRELSRQGIGFVDRHSSMLADYFQGAEGSTKQQVAELLHTGILERLRGATARWDIGDAKNGTLAKMENIFFKITGINAMTANKRAGAQAMMAHHFGKLKGKEFAELGERETQIMQSFGIGEKEWKLLQSAEWAEVADPATGELTRYFTPDIATRIGDDAIGAYLKDRGPLGMSNAAVLTDNVSDYVRKDIGMRLWAYFAERGNYAVIEVGPKERAMLYQGTRPGEPLNLALKLLLQFKQFPTSMVTKAWGADIYGLKGMDRIAGVVELAVASTVYGMMANFLNQLAKGQDPTSQYRNQPAQAFVSGFVRGGAASIYGDFLLGEWSRFGLSAAATLLGPSVGQIDRVAELWSDLTHLKEGHKTGALATRMTRENIPFLNMIYTRMITDYLITYRLQEWMNPGYLERMERTMRDKQGLEYLLRPSQPAMPQIQRAMGM